LMNDILGKKNSFETYTPTSFFPGETPCIKDIDDLNSPECHDRQAIHDIYSDLQQLTSALGCPQANPTPTAEPSAVCPEGEEKASTDTDKALEPVIDGFKKALEQADEDLRLHPASEGLRERYEQYKEIKELLEHIKAGSCVPSDLIQTLNELSQGREGACPEFCNALFNWLEKMGLAKDSDRATFFPGCSTTCEAVVPSGK
jgi:hypothetical protein